MTNATDTSKTLGESMFAQCGYAQDAIDRRVSQVWYEIFEGPNKFYWENDEGLAYVMDTGNNDVRTEGMSYAMMIALQYDRKDVFDKLWGLGNASHVHEGRSSCALFRMVGRAGRYAELEWSCT